MPRYRRIPPRRPTPWARTLASWAVLVGGVAALVLVAAWSERLPAPAPATAPRTEFSAVRAWPTLAHLADTIGHRVSGTAGAERALAYLERELRGIRGVEVQVQDVRGVRLQERGPLAYRARNLLARLPGRRPEAVLVSMHYDSPASSVGAADDAIAVAAALEMVRALAAEGQPEHTIVFNFNDAEEQGLLGAHGFLQHPWWRDVRAFVNLESAGNEGKAILFQSGPNNAWLARRVAGSAPHPYGSVFGQDIFRSGLIPSQTDFAVYAREGGVPGVDMAFYRGGWAYHTTLDRVARIAPGSVQHIGANALAVTRALAAGPLPGDVGGAPGMYYDVLGLGLLAYGRLTALLLGVGAALLALVAVRAAVGAGLTTGGETGVAFLLGTFGAVLGVAAAVTAGAIGPYLFGRPHGWFSHPLRGAVAFGAAALTVMLLLQWAYARRRRARDVAPDARAAAVWGGALLFHALVLVVTAAMGLGVSYLFLWWTIGGAIGLLLLARSRGERWGPAVVVGMVPGALVTVQATYLLVALFVPIAGRFLVPFPFDLVIATIVGLCAAALFALPLAVVQRGERLAGAVAGAGVVALVALAATWMAFPYTPDRPQRLLVSHEGDAGAARLTLRAADFPGPTRAASTMEGAPSSTAGTDGAIWFAAPPLAEPPPLLELIGERTAPDGQRVLDLRLQPQGAYRVRLRTPDAAVRWAIQATSGTVATTEAASRADFVGTPDGGWIFSVTAPAAAPVRFTVDGVHATPSAAAQDLMRRLPRWATVAGERLVQAEVTL